MTIPGSVTSIGYSTFYYCTSLTGVTIQEGVTSIETWAFFDCKSLTDITIPSSVTSIESKAFEYCTSLADVTILNPECEIQDHQDTLGVYGGATTIHGYDGSTAQTYAEKYGKKAVRKNLTIPAWLNTFAENNHINFSQVLQDALISRVSG